MPYIIRLLHAEDMDRAAGLIRRAFATVAEEFGLTKENCPGNGAFISKEILLDRLQRGTRMFGLEHDGEAAGFVALKKKDAETWYLEKIAVLPAFRHNGYGGALLSHATDLIHAEGGRKISIGIIADNAVLRRWYEKHGFTAVENRRFASLPFLVCYMEKPLRK